MPIVYIDIDSLRADHLGIYGYDAPTSPNIDELAGDAVQFERMYVANSPCMPSRAAFLAGRYGLNNGVETHGVRGQQLHSPHNWRLDDGNPHAQQRDYWTLPELFFRERIQNVAISSFPRHPATWFYHLWSEFHHPREPIAAQQLDAPGEFLPDDEGEYMITVRGETVADETIDFLQSNENGEFFLYAQFWDPHLPYKRSDEDVERFLDETSLPPYPTEEQFGRHSEWDAWRSPTQMRLKSREDLREIMAAYDAEIRYMDHHVGRILSTLRELGLYEGSLIIVTADHGEEFGEHGVYGEHWSTYDGTQRVPLLVKPPAGSDATPSRRDQLVTNVDIAPTIADYAGLEPASEWQGRSVRPIVENPTTDWRDYVVVDHGAHTVQRAIRTDRWKLIKTLHAAHWEGVLPDKQLFDMQSDPWEQDDIAESHVDIVKELEKEMALWVERHIGREEDELHAVAREGPSEYSHRANRYEGV